MAMATQKGEEFAFPMRKYIAENLLSQCNWNDGSSVL